MRNCNMSNCNMPSNNMPNCNMPNCNMPGNNMTNNTMPNCNMPNCNMSRYEIPRPMMPESNHSMHRNESMCNCGEYPIGMGYVPWQEFRNLFDPDRGLHAGTAFAELEKPFIGRRTYRR